MVGSILRFIIATLFSLSIFIVLPEACFASEQTDQTTSDEGEAYYAGGKAVPVDAAEGEDEDIDDDTNIQAPIRITHEVAVKLEEIADDGDESAKKAKKRFLFSNDTAPGTCENEYNADHPGQSLRVRRVFIGGGESGQTQMRCYN